MRTIEIEEAALKKKLPPLLWSNQTNKEKNKINYTDLKKETTTPTSEECKIEDVQDYSSNELMKVTELKKIFKENRFYC